MQFKNAVAGLVIASCMVTASPARAVCCQDGLIAGSLHMAAISGQTGLLLAAMGLQSWLAHEDTASIVGVLEGNMKIGALATADALNSHKNLIIMALAAGEKSRIASEQSLNTLPLVNQTVAAGMYSRIGLDKSAEVASIANTSVARRHLTTNNSSGNVLNSYQTYRQKYTEKGGMPNADILADSLLVGAGQRGAGVHYTFSQQQLEAAHDFLNNAVDVSPPADIPEAAANTVEGRKFRMLLRADKAKMSLSLKVFSDAIAYRTAIPGFAPGTKIGMKKPGDISYMEFLNHEVARRYNNSDWYVAVGGSTPANLQREALFMKSLDLHLQMESLKRMEKIELLLAQMNLNQAASSPLRQQIENQRARVGR